MSARRRTASRRTQRPSAPTRREVRRLLGWHRMPLGGGRRRGVIVAALVPFVTSDSYLINLLILIFIYAILNQAWNLTLGMTGAWNFGQLALFADRRLRRRNRRSIDLGVSPWLAMLIGALVAAVANVVLAIPSMRLRGIYVAPAHVLVRRGRAAGRSSTTRPA